MQDWFQTQFEYSTTVQRGHSNDAMLDFLRIKTGYCEQFSGTFGAMARAVGLPTRVMVGFTQGVLRSDGLYHIAGRHAHAWDEVWFDGYGWVLFDPTPGRGAPGAEGHTGLEARQEEGSGPTGGTASNDTPTPTVAPVSIPRDRPEFDGPTGPSIPRDTTLTTASDDGSASGWIVFAILLAILAWVVAMPRVVSRWSRRRHKEPAERVDRPRGRQPCDR